MSFANLLRWSWVMFPQLIQLLLLLTLLLNLLRIWRSSCLDHFWPLILLHMSKFWHLCIESLPNIAVLQPLGVQIARNYIWQHHQRPLSQVFRGVCWSYTILQQPMILPFLARIFIIALTFSQCSIYWCICDDQGYWSVVDLYWLWDCREA